MGLLEQQNLLAKIYTDEQFRQRFLAEPELIGKDFDLSEPEIADLRKILPDEINAFSESLFYKRLRGVERFLPLTRKFLAEGFEKEFREFSQNFNPKTVNKHLEDACEFARFLEKRLLEPVWIKDLAKFESGKLEFVGYGKKFVFKSFNFDLRGVFQMTGWNSIELKERKTRAIWFQIGKIKRHFIF